MLCLTGCPSLTVFALTMYLTPASASNRIRSVTSTTTARSPRAPTPRSSAILAISFTAASVNTKSAPWNLTSFLNCALTDAARHHGLSRPIACQIVSLVTHLPDRHLGDRRRKSTKMGRRCVAPGRQESLPQSGDTDQLSGDDEDGSASEFQSQDFQTSL